MPEWKPSPSRGFSLVELLVALVFTMLLMAGMAGVFKSSLSTFTTSGEALSSARRNRQAIDLLYDDLNSAGLYLNDLAAPPAVSANVPPFSIQPNQDIAGHGADDPATADQLLFMMDQPVPFEGTLSTATGSGGTARTAAQMVLAQAAPAPADNTYTIECGDPSYATLVKTGQAIIFKDAWETPLRIATVTPSGSTVTVTTTFDAAARVTGVGATGAPAKQAHAQGSGVVFFLPQQMVRYSVQMRNLDPQVATGIPCLIREQGAYSAAGFVPDANQTSIVTENVSNFKVYLSADSGQNWVGSGQNYTTWNAMRAALDTQLSKAGRAGRTSTQGDENWFRAIPVLVRVDVTTRTAVKRAEYSNTPLTTSYKNTTQSFVLVPRHFGLPLD